jgi:hypothetical protein
MVTNGGTLAIFPFQLFSVTTVPLRSPGPAGTVSVPGPGLKSDAGAVSPTVQLELPGAAIISGLHENTFKLGGTETLPPESDRFSALPEVSKAEPPEIRTRDTVFETSAERSSFTVATTPSTIPVVSSPHVMQVVAPDALLQETDLPEAEAEGPGTTETEEKSALE